MLKVKTEFTRTKANLYDVPVQVKLADGITIVSSATVVSTDEVGACEEALIQMEKFLDADGTQADVYVDIDKVEILVADVIQAKEILS